MAYAPDGTLLEVLDDGKQEEEMEKPKGTPKGEKGREGTGTACGGKGGPSACRCGGAGEYEPDHLRLANVLEKLVAALHETGRGRA